MALRESTTVSMVGVEGVMGELGSEINMGMSFRTIFSTLSHPNVPCIISSVFSHFCFTILQ